jgi:ElaB/YqjD/DUF883 family membrane-anchored ribosome-binding protein
MKNEPDAKALPPEELIAELRALTAELETLFGGADIESSQATLESLRERYAALQERIGRFYTDTKTKIVSGAKQTDDTIRANPYASLAVALGIGVLIGALIGRRER